MPNQVGLKRLATSLDVIPSDQKDNNIYKKRTKLQKSSSDHAKINLSKAPDVLITA